MISIGAPNIETQCTKNALQTVFASAFLIGNSSHSSLPLCRPPNDWSEIGFISNILSPIIESLERKLFARWVPSRNKQNLISELSAFCVPKIYVLKIFKSIASMSSETIDVYYKFYKNF